MRILRHATAAGRDRGAVLAIGNFDGVHLGHQTVIAEARARARAAGAAFAVLTFEPHPRAVFQPGTAPFRLTPFRDKARLMAELGVELLVAHRFDLAFAQRSAEDFVGTILVEGMGARHVVVGYDFVFGNRRRGTPVVLRTLGDAQGFGVSVVDPVTSASGAIYASTGIRDHLAHGRPREAASLLGRPWEVGGRVRGGDRRGRTIGFPTANLALGDYLRPASGVYAVRVGIEDGAGTRWYDGAANLGWRPTVGGQDLRLEAHLFDFADDLYGRRLRVAFIEHLRPERRFAGLDALKAQIAEDCARARDVLAAPAPALVVPEAGDHA
ncbi:MAG TPA: bifunctional riboflavin kinase/FAD synthetase [Stellaceae bacterium]|nr:bifunctional riboflavin kinase/FAD synthetase [Stellaceae bacterium]